MKTMDPSTWSPYSQQPFTHGNGGSPRNGIVQPSTPTDESLNSYGSANMLLSPCQGLQTLPSRPSPAESNAQPPPPPPPPLLNSHYDSSLISPPIRTAKETTDFFGNNLFNGVCKESQPTIPDFIQTSSLPSRNEGMNCLSSESPNNGFHQQITPVSFQPKNIDRPSPGPFGVLPHEAVMTRPNRYDRNKDKFVSPNLKPASTHYNAGQFPEQDVNNSSVYTSTPLTTHSVYSNDNASRSPVVNTVTSPTMSNFSSPSDYYSSPKNNLGAYNNVQSPVPQSPSVAQQQSYPSSPFTNIDPTSHIPTAPPCSPITTGSYLNKLQDRGVGPQRNGQKSQHSPGSNSGLCFNPPPSQGNFHHGHPPAMPKSNEFHSDYNAYNSHNHISSTSYPPVYPAIHPNQMPCEDPSITPRPHVPHNPNMPPHDNRLQYSHSNSMPTNMGSPTYLQSKSSSAHDMMYNSCPSNLPANQPMHHPGQFDDCSPVIDPLNNHNAMQQPPPPPPPPPPPLPPPPPPPPQQQQQNHNSVLPPMMHNGYGYQPPDMSDDKNALDMFNTHIDSGVHNPDTCQSSLTSFLEAELPTLETSMLTNQEMRLSDPNQLPPMNSMGMDNLNSDMVQHPQMTNFNDNTDLIMKNNMNCNYNTNTDICRMNNMPYAPVPRGRGRRGRRRRADIHNRGSYCRYQRYKTERNTYYSNGYQMDRIKFPEFNGNNCFNNTNNNSNKEYRNNDNFNHYQTSYKDRLDAYEFHTPCYTPSKYQSVRKKDVNRMQNCIDVIQPKPKQFFSVEEELRFLGELKFPLLEVRDSPHTFMKTRNKDLEGFLQSYKNFLEIRKSVPEEEEAEPVVPAKEQRHSKELQEEKEPKNKPKLIIKMGRCRDHSGWQLTSPAIVSNDKASESSNSLNSHRNSANHSSSHKVSDDSNSMDGNNDKHKGNSDVYSEKLSKRSAKRIFKYIGRNKNSDNTNNHFTNSDTLPAGNAFNSEKPTAKKRGRKAKNSGAAQKKHSNTKNAADDPLKNLPHPIKEEVISDEEVKTTVPSRRSSLRLKKEEVTVKEESKDGRAIMIKVEPVEVSSDSVDDSDSDPAWTPSSRAPKTAEFANAQGEKKVVKKRRRSGKRSHHHHHHHKRGKKDADHDGNPSGRPRKTPGRKPKGFLDPEVKVKMEKQQDLFVIAKGDLAKEKPPIWRVDQETRMIQRFDAHEEQGMSVYRNTYAYAAWNSVTRGQYIQAKVKVLSLTRVLYAVQYLGVEDTANLIPDPSELTATPHPLRESFEIFLQTLISQAVDEHFLSAIIKENDEYFLANINKIEKVSLEKKNRLFKQNWDKEIKDFAELYPCVNILSCDITQQKMCQICATPKAEKLVQFYGPPYDSTTLGSTDSPAQTKPQFTMCIICSTTISLYSRLHHQKYNFFVECRGKVLQFQRHRQAVDKSAAFHDVLDHCLHDSKWISMLFHDMETVWNECDRVS